MRVLVVDDDRLVVDTLRALIEDLGHEAVGATSGSEALDHFRRGRYDLVVVDLRMPQMDGAEVLHRLRLINRDTRLVALTGQVLDLPDVLVAANIPLVRKPVFTKAAVSELLSVG